MERFEINVYINIFKISQTLKTVTLPEFFHLIIVDTRTSACAFCQLLILIKNLQ